MTKEEYVTTLTIDGKRIDVGIDDYGQCYFLSFKDRGGEKDKEVCLGTYSVYFLEDAFYFADPVYRHLSNREFCDDFTDSERELWDTYCKMIENIYKDMGYLDD